MFFISGKWMRSHPEITQQLIEDPLFEAGNHACSHDGLEGCPSTQTTCEAFVDKVQSWSIVLLHGNHVQKHIITENHPTFV